MPSVLHVLTRFRRGGMERNVLHFIDWQRRAGYDVHIAVGQDTLFDELPPWPKYHRIPGLVRPVSPVNDARAFSDLRHLIESMPFDIVHTHQSKAGVLGRMAARGRTPALVHTVHMPAFGAGYPPLASAAFLRAERFCARFTDVIVTVGEGLRRAYLQRVVGSPEKYEVVRSPIDIERYLAIREASPQKRVEARMRFGLAPDAKVVVNVGALETRKRHDLLLARLAPALAEGTIRLLVAGAGPEQARLEEVVDRLGIASHVKFLGFVDDVDRLLLAADVLVSTAAAEGTPQVVVQALAAGRPVVATEVCGLREVTGASVTVVGQRAQGLLRAVRLALDSPPKPAAPAAFEPWCEAIVEQQIASLHERLRWKLVSP